MTTSYTLRPKTLDMIEKHLTQKETPGAGTYKTIELEPIDGRYLISKFHDTKFAKINPRTPRFQTIKESPGPLSYREGDNLHAKGRYVLSQRKGNGIRTFENQARFTIDFWKPNTNPGPANYDKPSDFGVYGDAKYYKTLDTFKSK